MERTTEDISSKNKPKCLALGIGGGALAALMLVGIVAAVGGGGAWCYLQGPCAPAKPSEQSGTAAPSEVIGKDMSAEFSSGESGTSSTSSRLRRRLADATGKIALSSGVKIDVNDLILAGTKNSFKQTSFTEASPAFMEGVAAQLKTDAKYATLAVADRIEIVETMTRTLVRVQVKKELAPSSAWYATLVENAIQSVNAESSCQTCFKANKNCCGVKSNYQCWTSSSEECAHLSSVADVATDAPVVQQGRRLLVVPGDKLGAWTSTGGDELKNEIMSNIKFDNLAKYKANLAAEGVDATDATTVKNVIHAVNTLNPSAKGFAENIKNTSAVLAAMDFGFTTATDTIASVDKINKGLAAGFVPRSSDTAGEVLFETMDQRDMSQGMGNASEGMSALALNSNLLGDSDKLAEGLTRATKVSEKRGEGISIFLFLLLPQSLSSPLSLSLPSARATSHTCTRSSRARTPLFSSAH